MKGCKIGNEILDFEKIVVYCAIKQILDYCLRLHIHQLEDSISTFESVTEINEKKLFEPYVKVLILVSSVIQATW